MYTAVGAGGFCGSLTMASFSRLVRGLPQFVMGVGFSLTLVAFALSQSYLISLGLLFVMGFTHQAYTTINQTLIVTRTAPELYGRVTSINLMMRSFITMAVLPIGALADRFGAPYTLAACGGLLAGLLLLIGAIRGTGIPEGVRSV